MLTYLQKKKNRKKTNIFLLDSHIVSTLGSGSQIWVSIKITSKAVKIQIARTHKTHNKFLFQKVKWV